MEAVALDEAEFEGPSCRIRLLLLSAADDGLDDLGRVVVVILSND